jgi:hypothetical protein
MVMCASHHASATESKAPATQPESGRAAEAQPKEDPPQKSRSKTILIEDRWYVIKKEGERIGHMRFQLEEIHQIGRLHKTTIDRIMYRWDKNSEGYYSGQRTFNSEGLVPIGYWGVAYEGSDRGSFKLMGRDPRADLKVSWAGDTYSNKSFPVPKDFGLIQAFYRRVREVRDEPGSKFEWTRLSWRSQPPDFAKTRYEVLPPEEIETADGKKLKAFKLRATSVKAPDSEEIIWFDADGYPVRFESPASKIEIVMAPMKDALNTDKEMTYEQARERGWIKD